ncbi:hypothetical protein F5Y02DRAFT_398821 [Annulohypoxylon stygium]|nr:hypothetical protein F5Y02DRAFT_398821 [Annulohypoxylon stygium]
METYIYTRLQHPYTIRLLRVFGSSLADSPIQCEVLQVSLSSPPSYEAVSYAWEGQTPSEVIVCNDRSFLVTKNCQALLQRFRPTEKGSTRLL